MKPTLKPTRAAYDVLIRLVLGLFVASLVHPAQAEPLPRHARDFLARYCYECHGPKQREAEIDFSRFGTEEDVIAHHEHWRTAARLIESREMPSEKAARQPSDAERARMLQWIRDLMRTFAEQNDGDPGVVPPRRLTAAEYQYCIEDITGAKIRCTSELPPDLTGQAGFTNTASQQGLTPGHLATYLRAAKHVSRRAVLVPSEGLVFRDRVLEGSGITPFAESLRNKLEEKYQRILSRTHKRQGQDLNLMNEGPYALGAAFFTVWQFRHREHFDGKDLTTLANDNEVDPRYAQWILEQLEQETDSQWVRQIVLEPLQKLPAPQEENIETVRNRCDEIAAGIANTINSVFKTYCHNTYQPDGPDGAVFSLNNVALLRPEDMIRLKEKSSKKGVPRLYVALGDGGIPQKDVFVKLQFKRYTDFAETLSKRYGWEQLDDHTIRVPVPALFEITQASGEPFEVKQGLRSEFLVEFDSGEANRCVQIAAQSFPIKRADGSVLKQAPAPGTLLPNGPPQFAGRCLESKKSFNGYCELMERFAPQLVPYPFPKQSIRHFHFELLGLPPEDQLRYPFAERFLRACVYRKEEQTEIDALWMDYEAVARIPWKQSDRLLSLYQLSDVPPGDRARLIEQLPEDDIMKWDRYLQTPIHPSARWRSYVVRIQQIQSRLASIAPVELQEFAGKAWRRPLTEAERDRIAATFAAALGRDGDPQEAVRFTITSILTSPHFLLRVEEDAGEGEIVSVERRALAARLSFLLWSSMPDDELVAALATNAELDDILGQQLERMKRDPKIERFVIEFFGQWLGFKGFHQYDNVDRERHPAFTDGMRQLLYEQNVRYFEDLIQNDRPVTEILIGGKTMLNPPLADYYGIDYRAVPWPQDSKGKAIFKLPGDRKELYNDAGAPRETRLARVEVSSFGRRGVLGMGSLLTLHSKRLRTDPVARGAWVYETLLGRELAPPPADVPTIGDDDGSAEKRTLRQRLERHITVESCANCHAKFDALGFALERFDPIGRVRKEEWPGQPIVEDLAPIDESLSGPDGLNAYLAAHRHEFLDNFSRKLLSYALGRNLIASDEPLIGRMLQRGEQNGHSFSSYLQAILESQQFQRRRVRPKTTKTQVGSANQPADEQGDSSQ